MLRLTERAEADLAEIWAYVAAEASEASAKRLINKIKGDMSLYCEFPHSGPAREQLAKGLRAAFSGNYVVYYRPAETELTIVRVLHGARDTAAVASSGGFQ